MNFEVELRESQGKSTLDGVILQEGRAATGGRAELFAPDSVEWPSGGVGVLLEHRGAVQTRGQVVRERDGKLRLIAQATQAVKDAWQAGKRFMSVEFVALEERTTAAGVREVLRAFVPYATLTTVPEYDTATVEVRSRASTVEERCKVWL